MSSFVFNSFKKRYLNGEVPVNDNWTFIPVSEDFKNKYEHDDVKLEMYRSLSDFNRVSPETFKYECSAQGPYIKGKVQTVSVNDPSFKLNGTGLINGKKIYINWKKGNSTTQQPIFINKNNYSNFKNIFKENISGNNYIDSYINSGGFYYIRNEGELDWFADKSLKNNKIIGLFGNDISAVIDNPIGSDENTPFEGILDGNYHKFHLMIKGRHTDNGLVGVLGQHGIVRNFKIKGTSFNNSIECDKQITLEHIKKDGRDINCGMLVGRNYGRIENIDAGAMGEFKLYAFVPSVYSVTNKADKYKWNEWKNPVREKYDGNNDNFFYLNSFCINSPANICPYVGYFNEGKFSEGIEGVIAETVEGIIPEMITVWGETYKTSFANWFKTDISNTKDTNISINNNVLVYPILGNFSAKSTDTSSNAITSIGISWNSDISIEKYNTALKILTRNPYYYGVDSLGQFTVRDVGISGGFSTTPQSAKAAITGSYTVNYNSNLIMKAMGSTYCMGTSLAPSYENTRCSMRLHPQARAAFNVGTIIGANYGTAENIQVSTTVKNTSNFVGFIGGLAGKQSYGYINNVSIFMDNQFTYDFGNQSEYGDVVYLKQTPILPDTFSGQLENITDASIKERVRKDFFSIWHEDEVNTAKSITDDVVSYKLRPIFVVGGLFGRFTPSDYQKCSVNNSIILYKDNYNDTKNTNYKRPENAFGILVGKVDYSTVSQGILAEPKMFVSNCQFNSLTTVGDTFPYIEHYFENGYWVPKTNKTEDGLYSIANSGTVTSKYVGVYELKENIFDPISYNVNKSKWETVDEDNPSALIPERKSINDFGVYFAGDYPMDMSSHFGGIIKAHNFWNKIDKGAASAWVKWVNNANKPQTWDVSHRFYMDPNYSPSYVNTDLNRRNLASNIISLNQCFGNVQNYIEVYDDYISQYKLMELPPVAVSSDSSKSGGIPESEITSNKFAASSIDFIKTYWSEYRSNSNADLNVNDGGTDNPVYKNLNLPESLSSSWSNSSIQGFFHRGLINAQLNPFIRQGTLNTFDGYTTVDFELPGHYNVDNGIQTVYKDVPDQMAGIDATASQWKNPLLGNTFLTDKNLFTFGRKFKKNIQKHLNNSWSCSYNNDVKYKTIVSFPDRKSTNYTNNISYNISYNEDNNISTAMNPLSGAFAYTLPVNFNTSGTLYGYTIPYTSAELTYSYNNGGITVGEYMSPNAILNKLEDTEIVQVSSISSYNNYGGLLVVDSSGRTVMFFDNENPQQLTGNVIKYPTIIDNSKSRKYILRVQ